jgi:hypothetical protein
METQGTLITEITTIDPKAIQVIAESGVEKSTAKMLQESFSPFFQQAGSVIDDAKSIVVTDLSETDKMTKARELRLVLKNTRIAADKKRMSLKEDSNRYGKAVQGIYNVLDYLIVPVEKYLAEQEEFAERIEAKKKEELTQKRILEVQPFSEFIPIGIDLGSISDDDFSKLLSGAKFQTDAKKEAEAKAESDRITKEKAESEEREKVKIENDRLKKEAAEREKLQAKEREENEKALKVEREAREKAEAERMAIERKIVQEQELENKRKSEEKRIADKKLADEKATEAKRMAEEKEAERKAKNAPDKEKIISFVSALSLMEYPDVKSEDAKKILSEAKIAIGKIAGSITNQANAL